MSRDDLGYNLKLFSEYLIQKINHRILIQRISRNNLSSIWKLVELSTATLSDFVINTIKEILRYHKTKYSMTY